MADSAEIEGWGWLEWLLLIPYAIIACVVMSVWFVALLISDKIRRKGPAPRSGERRGDEAPIHTTEAQILRRL
jgi:hypothetical protein